METVLSTPKEQLLARLDDPDVVDTLNRLLDQLPLLTFGAEALSEFIHRGDTLTDNISSGIAELRQTVVLPEVPGGGLQFFETMAGTIPGLMKTGAQLAETATKPAINNLLSQGLIEELGKPETIDLFKRLLDKLELIVFAVEATDGFLRRSDAIIESIRDSVKDAMELLPDKATLSQLENLAASAPHVLEAASTLIDSGMVFSSTELTVREREILQLIAESHTTQEIAELLNISPHTATRHRANLMQKLAAHSQVGLIRAAAARGLIVIPQTF